MLFSGLFYVHLWVKTAEIAPLPSTVAIAIPTGLGASANSITPTFLFRTSENPALLDRGSLSGIYPPEMRDIIWVRSNARFHTT